MDVRAIILIGGGPEAAREQLGGVPFAMLDVLGASLLSRVAQRMREQGVGNIAVVSEFDQFPDRNLPADLRWFNATDGQFWRFTEAVFNDFAQNGAALVLVLRLGPYVDFDVEAFIQFHLDSQSRVSQACDSGGKELDLFVLSASRRNDAAFLFRNMLRRFRLPPELYPISGYVNRLEAVADFRRLALDSFAGSTGLMPRGTELRPGVWMGPNARIHPKARILAPAYVGSHSRIRAQAVLTRGSVIERNCEVDCGSVIENSTLLPFSYVGAGLDVTCSVVGFRHVAHLLRQVEVEISDRRLIDMASTNPSIRTLVDMLSLAVYMPQSLYSSLRAKKRELPATLPEAVEAAPSSLSVPTEDRADRQFATELVGARRYGNE